MHTAITICAALTVIWCLVACAVALVVGRSIRIADVRELGGVGGPPLTRPGTTASTVPRT